VTINGHEQVTDVPNPDYPCIASPTSSATQSSTSSSIRCPPFFTVYDNGSVSITVNGHTNTAYYGRGSTAYSIAAALVSNINNDPGSFVQAGVMGTTVWLVSKTTQSANYTLSSATTYDDADFSQPSFTTTNSGTTLTGSP